MFRITENWVMIPQLLYYILLFGSGLGVLLSAVGLYGSVRQKKDKKPAFLWAGILAICLMIGALIFTGKVVGHRMIGG